jgi:hypothetical protein
MQDFLKNNHWIKPDFMIFFRIKMTEKSREPFHVIVKPIGPVCNLVCKYCYYLDKKSLYPDKKSFRMSAHTLEEITKQYIRSQPEGIQEIQFAWQGGEKFPIPFKPTGPFWMTNGAGFFMTNHFLLESALMAQRTFITASAPIPEGKDHSIRS